MNKYLTISLLITCISQTISAQSVFNDKAYALINQEGITIKNLKAKHIYPFSNERARISLYAIHERKATFNEGFIDLQGNIVIPALYEEARDFQESVPVTWVKVKGSKHFQLIDIQGNRVGNINADYVGTWADGICQVGILDPAQKMPNGQLGYKYGFVNTDGKWVIPADAQLIGASAYSEGTIALEYKNNSKGFGFFDTNGDTLLPMKYVLNGAPQFHQGLARIPANGKSYFINKSGDTVFSVPYTNITGYGDSMILVAFGKNYDKFGYIDYHGQTIIEGQYSRAEAFRNGYAVVYNTQRAGGIIDQKGNAIVPFDYTQVFNHADKGYFSAIKGDKWTHYNIKGEVIYDYEMHRLQNPSYTMYNIQETEGGKWQYYNTNGEPINTVKYCNAYPMNEYGVTIVELCK